MGLEMEKGFLRLGRGTVQLFNDTMLGACLTREVEVVWVWKPEVSEVFSVKSAYTVLQGHLQAPIMNDALNQV